jgi:hypothetical protein
MYLNEKEVSKQNNDSSTGLCSDSSKSQELLQNYPGIKQDYERATSMIQSGDSDSILKGFVFLCDIFKNSKNRIVCEEIISMHNQAQEMRYSDSSGTNGKITAQAIILTYDKFKLEMGSDITFRSCQTGKTPEQLHLDDELEAKQRRQSENWHLQGLCRYCGGSLGFFKKCKSCGAKN